jgi:hypothetical protein
MGEIDQLHHWIGLAGKFVHIHLRFEEKRLHRFVGLQKRPIRLSNDLIAQIIELTVRQPFFIVGGAVQRADRVAENIQQHPFTEASAQTGRRIRRNKAVALIDYGPAQLGELIEKRLFDVEVLGHGILILHR